MPTSLKGMLFSLRHKGRSAGNSLGNSSELQTALSLPPWPSPSLTWKHATPIRTLTRTTQRRHSFHECDFNAWPSYWGSCHITANEIKHFIHQKSQTTNFPPLPICEQIKLSWKIQIQETSASLMAALILSMTPWGTGVNSLIQVYLRFQRHAFPQQKHDIWGIEVRLQEGNGGETKTSMQLQKA